MSSARLEDVYCCKNSDFSNFVAYKILESCNGRSCLNILVWFLLYDRNALSIYDLSANTFCIATSVSGFFKKKYLPNSFDLYEITSFDVPIEIFPNFP